MEQTLRIIGDAASIVALSIIASVSLNAWNRILPGALVPMAFNRQGDPSFRMKKPIALLFMPFVAMIFLLLPTASGATHTAGVSSGATILFTLRLILGAGLALAHLTHTRHAMEVLGKEGQLRS